MEQYDLLRFIVSVLDKCGFRYCVTGSMATIFYGEPRFTNDIDIVIDLPYTKVSEFCRAFPSDEFYLSKEAVLEAVRNCGQFNIIHPPSGMKIDIIIPPDTPFNRSRFGRVVRVKPAADYEASFASMEDVIIKKMEYYREGESEKHLRDIAGVLKISGEQVDRKYIADWSSKLGLSSIWQAVLDRFAK